MLLIKIDTLAPDDVEPFYLLKVTCPSTGHIHAICVRPDIRSARAERSNRSLEKGCKIFTNREA